MAKITTEVAVSDMQKSLEFYNLIGFTKADDGIIDDKGSQWSSLALGDAAMWLIREDIVTGLQLGERRGNGVNIYVSVDDVDAVYDRVNKGGLKMNIVHDIKTEWYGLRQFSVLDPDGYLLTINTQVSEGVSPEEAAAAGN